MRAINWSSMFSDSPAREDLSLRRKDDDARYSIPFEIGYRDGEVQLSKGAIAGANLELWLHGSRGATTGSARSTSCRCRFAPSRPTW